MKLISTTLFLLSLPPVSTSTSDEQSASQTLAEFQTSSTYAPFPVQSSAETKVSPTFVTLTVSPRVNNSEGGSANLKSSAGEIFAEKQAVRAFEKVHQAASICYVDQVIHEREHNTNADHGNHRTNRRSINQAANDPISRSMSASQRYYLIGQASKQSHNEKERRRRSRMRKSCEKLRDLVPGVNEKTDKASVLEIAVEYIQHLHEYLGQKQSQTESS